jgi:RNA polymerase sigma-70 factor (ECF subfamily)
LNEADLKLIQAAQEGDRQAFGQLVERFKGKVFAAALAISGNRDEARELTQETFVRALQGLPKLQEPERFPAWLRGIAHTAAKDGRRRTARDRRHTQAAGQLRPNQQGAVDEAVAQREESDRAQALLADLVSALPEDVRVALDLRFREDLSYAQIGEAMGVPASTVRGLLYRGTKALRTKMRPMLKRAKGSVQ